MGQMISFGKELIRINPEKKNVIEYSKNDGRSWVKRYYDNSKEFLDLVDNGNEILAQTTKGLYYSKNDGRSWVKR